MPAVSFSPIFNGYQAFSSAGLPLAFGTIETYIAGSSTPLATYTTAAGNIANANPITLLIDGRPPQEIWLIQGNAYRFVLKDFLGNQIGTYEDITGIEASGGAGSLRTQLADPTSAANGAGLEGLNATLSYAQQTSGAHQVRHPHVKDYPWLAKGDGTTDDTAAINAALTWCAANNITTLDCLGGKYRITSKLTIPSRVLLKGMDWLPDPSNLQQALHTSIYVDFGSGAAPGSGSHAVEMSYNSGIEGVTFWYPGQVAKTVATPISFDYSVSTPTAGSAFDNIWVRNVTFFNSYAALNLSNGGRWRVEGLQGDPLFIGFKADQCFDSCYAKDIHWWVFYTQGSTLYPWVLANSTGFLFGRVDQLYGSNFTSYARNVAYDLGTNFWGCLSNINCDLGNIPIRCTGTSQTEISNFVLISTGAARPAIHIVSGANGVNFSNGIITSTASVGAQIDGGDSVKFSNVDFKNTHSAVVCTNTTTDVQLNACTWNVPPFGTSNVKINGIPLPAISTVVTLPAPAINPTVIGGGYRFDLSTAGLKRLAYDVGTFSQRNSLHILEFDYTLVGTSTTHYFQFTIDKDIGGQLQVSYQPVTGLILNSTVKKVRIPFFINGSKNLTYMNISVTPTVTVPGSYIDITNIVLYEASNISMSDAQVAAMIRNGYNLDFYGVGASTTLSGKNRIVYPTLDAAIGRGTEVPTQGAWIVGDKMAVLAPATVAGSWKLCTVAGTPGTWV